MGPLPAFLNRVLPPVPDEIRDAFTRLQYAHLRSQIPLLYLSTILITVSATMAARDLLSPVLRMGIPLIVGVVCFMRLFVWLRRSQQDVPPERARALMRNMVVISGSIGALCSYWCVYSWLGSAPDNRTYFPLFMAMGTLSTAYALSTVRTGALTNLVVGMPPMIIALLLSGRQMDLAAAASLIVATTFQLRMIQEQHSQLVAMLELQHRMALLADTDALTGLINRRALHARFEQELAQATPDKGPALLLADLDGFKPVNDQHGHLVGDEVLRQVAQRFERACESRGVVARLGGDEFAILLPAASSGDVQALATRLMSALVEPIRTEGLALRIGASAGTAHCPEDGLSPDALFKVADDALYRIKAEHKAQARTACMPADAGVALAG